MKTLALLLSALVTASAAAAGPAPLVRTLPNGLTVGVFRDTRLPIVQIQVLLPAGTARQIDREIGAASLVGWLVTRGTTSRSTQEFQAELEGLGGTINGSVSADYTSISAAFPASELERGMELVADALVNPIFPDDEVRKAKNEALATLFQSRAVPGVVADEHLWARMLPGHPAGISDLGTLETVASLTRAQLQQFHRECYRPMGSLVSVAGDVDPDRAVAVIGESFATWKGSPRGLRAGGPRAVTKGPIRLVDSPQMQGAEIRIGFPAPGAISDELPAIAVLNDLLGGSPTARIVVGAGRGLGGRSVLRTVGAGGMLMVSAAARPESAAAVITALRSDVSRFLQQPPDDADARASARTLARSFQLLNESTASQAAQWMGGRLHGLGDDYLEKYPARLQAVTADGVRAAAKKWLDLDRAQVVVVGPAKSLEPRLRALGEIEVVRVTDPAAAVAKTPAMRTDAPNEDEIARGKDLVAQAVAAHGGIAKLRGVKDLVIDSEVTLHSGGQTLAGTLKELKRDPWKMRVETTFPQIATVQALDDRRGWMRVSVPVDSVADEDSLGVAGMRVQFQADPVHLLVLASSPGARVALRGDDAIGDRAVRVVEVTSEGARWVLFLDSASHRLIGMEENAGSVLAGATLRRVYGDLRPEQGILWPHTEERLLDGERTIMIRVKSVRFNVGVPNDAFQKPGAAAPRARGR
jgi:zinc protease